MLCITILVALASAILSKYAITYIILMNSLNEEKKIVKIHRNV